MIRLSVCVLLDADVIERLNSLTDVINSGEERHFDGSKKLIWLGVIVGILMYWMMGVGMMFSTLIATGLLCGSEQDASILN